MRNMKSLFRKVLAFASMTALTILSGCGNDTSNESMNPTNIAVVNATNSNSVCLNIEELQSAIANTCRTDGYFSYIIADGDSFIAYHDSIQIERKGASQNNISRRVNSKSIEIAEQIGVEKPKTEEVDLFKALTLAAKDMRGKSNPTIFVYSNGLSTTGSLDMTTLTAIGNLDVTTTVEDLKKRNAIPDFTGCNIQFYLTGTAGEQASLSNNEESLIIDLWQKIIESGGGIFNYDYYLPDSKLVLTDAPYVTPVSVEGSSSSVREIPIDDMPAELPDEFVVTIGEEAIDFIPNTAEVKDEVKAKEKIAPLAKLIQDNQIDILLVGSTATVGDALSSVKLSEERCHTIARLLNEAGATTSIEIKGFGYDNSNPYFDNDIVEGQLDETIAKTNRKVVIIPLDSEQAKKILNE